MYSSERDKSTENNKEYIYSFPNSKDNKQFSVSEKSMSPA